MSVLVVTGTGTDVGKTIVTAAVAASAAAAGLRVCVVKPAQTGDESDVEVVRRLSGVDDVHELVRYPEPLAPATAARRAGVVPLRVDEMVARVRGVADRDLVLVEGAGGLLVHLDDRGGTLADVAAALTAPVLVVATAGLGTLNAVALTDEALRSRRLESAGVVFGRWPEDADLASLENRRDVEVYARAPLLGAIPDGAGALDPDTFRSAAPSWLAPALHGSAVVAAGAFAAGARQ